VNSNSLTSSLMRACLLAGVCALVGCRGDRSNAPPRQFFPDMDDQLKYKAQQESHFFDGFHNEHAAHGEPAYYGRTMRVPPAHTVPFGRQPHARLDGDQVIPVTFAGHDFAERLWTGGLDDRIAEGKNPDGSYVEYIPIEVTPELLALGQKNFNIFCFPCHGGTGHGDGLVGRRWANPVPSWHQPQYMHGGEKGQDGYVFRTIRYGVENPGGAWELKMPAYGSKMTVRESWAVVAYYRALQKAAATPIEQLPAGLRAPLERTRASTPPPSDPAAPAAQPVQQPAAGGAP